MEALYSRQVTVLTRALVLLCGGMRHSGRPGARVPYTSAGRMVDIAREDNRISTTSLAQAALIEQVRSRAAGGTRYVSCARCWTIEARCEGPPPPPGASRSEFAGRPGRWLALLNFLPLRILSFTFLEAALDALNPFALPSSRGRSRRRASGLMGRAGASSRHVFRPKAAHRDGFDPDIFCSRPATSSCFSSQSLYLSDRTRYPLRSPPSLALARRSSWPFFSRPCPLSAVFVLVRWLP